MSVTMLWCFWVAVGLWVFGFIVVMGIGLDAHTKADAHKEELTKAAWERGIRYRADLGNQAEELRLVNKALNELECRLQTIKDLL